MNEATWHPHEMPCLLVSRLSRLLSKRIDEELGVVGLTISQLPVLQSLKNGCELTQKELAEFADVAQPSMAQLLNRMERDGVVQRTPSTTDGRISMISLTPQAHRMLEPGREVLHSVDKRVCSILTDKERSLLIAMLQKLVRYAESEDAI